MINLSELLEKFKKQGNYAIITIYGEEIGCDDIELPQEDRNIQIIMTPVGYLGEMRKILKMTMRDLEDFDVNSEPVIISNPPTQEDLREKGYYMWGTDRAMESYKRKKEEGLE